MRRSLDQMRDTLEAAAAIPDASTIASLPRNTIEPRSKKSAEVARALGLLSPSQRGIDVHATLGEGGMGIVRLGTQRALGRAVAVKSLKAEARSDSTTLKLLREAWVTGALEHPNVVPVYDIDLDAEGEPQIVLKKIEGAPWSDLMNDKATLARRFHAKDPLEWNLRILQQVATAVHFAHSRGIVHRDLKPENVMIGSFGEVYLVDWGLAVSVKEDERFPSARDATEMAGTPCYMAPEMIGGHGAIISERTDVYLLGAILHEIATGRVPHEGESLMQILHSVARSEPEIPDSVPAELARIVRRAMDPDPDARFENAEQLRLAIGGFLEHRGSIRLADEAEERLEKLLEAKTVEGADESERRLTLYHLFGECRFGFLEALRTWRENAAARTGLTRAIEAMIEFELSANDGRAASILLAELPSPSAELRARVETAVAAANLEKERAQKLSAEHDETVGRRTRAFVGMILGSLWTIGPLLWAYLAPRWEFARSHWMAIDFAVITGVIAQSLYWWARDSLSKTVINRRLVWTVRISIWFQVFLYVGAYLAGISTEHTHVLLIFLWAVVTATTANAIDTRLAPAAVVSASAFLIAAAFPGTIYWMMSLANFGLLVNMAIVWSRLRDDVVEPFHKRQAERQKRWEAFLEKMRREDANEEP
jgi:hypothetical protein